MSNLPAVNPAALGKALTQATQRVALDSGSNPYLRLLKSGEWVYSADDIDVQEGSLWAVNPSTLSEGFAAWGNGDLKGEEMAPMTGDPITMSSLPDVGAQWKKQIGFLLRCMNGDDEGTQVLYKTTSRGGLKAANKLIAEIVEQIEADPANIVPVITLEMDSYKHKEYGKIYTPIFEVKDFMNFETVQEPVKDEALPDTEDEAEDAEFEEVEEEPKKKAPAKRRRKIAS